MHLLKALQSTLIELNRARAKSGRSLNEYNYIRNRVLNSIELHINEAELGSVIHSFDQLPHQVSQQPTTMESHQMSLFLQHLIDDFTSVLLMVERRGGEVRELFVSDKDFAIDIIARHSSGWMDSCRECGQSLHLKYDLFSKTVRQVQKRLRSADELVCNYHRPKPLELSVLCPSKKLVVSDSLNEFVIANSATLSEQYQVFLSNTLRDLSSSSLRGKALLSEFYASHNLGYFCVGKGPLYLTQKGSQTWLSKQAADQEAPLINIASLFVTVMDYAELCGFCHQLGLDIYETLKTQNARLIDVEQDVLRLRYSFNDSDTGLPSLCISYDEKDNNADQVINAIA